MRFLIRLTAWVTTFVTTVLLIALGAALTQMYLHDVMKHVDTYWNDLKSYLPEGLPYRQILGGIFIALGLIVALSFIMGGKKRRKKSITFAGAHGDVTIELESIEGVIEKVAYKLPEVKAISVRLEPTDARSRVMVLAETALMKDADADARMVTDRVQEYIKEHTRKILGVQDVDVRLTVKKFLLNMRSVKPMPLLLEGPKETTIVAVGPAEGQAPQAS